MDEVNKSHIIEKLIYNSKRKSVKYAIAKRICFFVNFFLKDYLIKITPSYKNTMMTHEALMNIMYLLREIIIKDVEGDIVELGCYDGLTSILISKTLKESNTKKRLFLYDSFEGLARSDFSKEDENIFLTPGSLKTSYKRLVNNYKRFNSKLPKVIIGDIRQTFIKKSPKKIAFAHIDLDLYGPTLFALKKIFPRLSKGAIVVLDDYGNPAIPGVKKAVSDYIMNKIMNKNLYIYTLYGGEYPPMPDLRPKVLGEEILKKYQAY